MAKANLLDPNVQAKKKRKQAIFLGVAFLVVLAVSVPQTMKMMNKAPAETTAAPTSSTMPGSTMPGSTVPGSTTSVGGSTATDGTAQAVAASSADALVVDADLAPAPLEGQLADFTVFDAKDPFVQQKVATPSFHPPGSSGAFAKTEASAAALTAPAAGVGTANVPTVAGPSTSSSTTGSTPTPTATAAPTGATISVNGVKESVSVGADFPAAAPLFHLVKLTAKSAEISVAGGTLASGAPTVKLELGKPLTLMNTADGTRYVVILVSTGSSAAASTPTP